MEIEPDDRSLVPANDRSTQLAQLSTLPDEQWADQISELYPDVAPAETLNADFQNLDTLGHLIVQQRRHIRRSIGLSVGMVVTAATGVVLENTNFVDPEIRRSLSSVGIPAVLAGFIGYSFYLMFSNFRSRITNLVTEWNGRGQNWVQQQRGRLRINL